MKNKLKLIGAGLAMAVFAMFSVSILVWLGNDSKPSLGVGTPPPSANIISSSTAEWSNVNQLRSTSTDFTISVNSDLTTTTISSYKRSIYRPTSTDDKTFVRSTTSDSLGSIGTPSKIFHNAYGNRRYASICVLAGYDPIWVFLSNVTTSDMASGRGILVEGGECYEINSLNLWEGAVWGMASSTDSTSTIGVFEAK